MCFKAKLGMYPKSTSRLVPSTMIKYWTAADTLVSISFIVSDLVALILPQDMQ